MRGCELVSSAAGEMKNPKRDVPRAVISSALAIALLYLISTFFVWAVVPTSEINVSSGIMQLFSVAFGSQGIGAAITIVLGLFILITLFAGVVAWTLGSNRTMAEAAAEGEMPAIFGKMTRNDAPLGASVISGFISTFVIVVYWFFADNAAEMFWQVTAFCLAVDLFAYLVIFPAFIKLRKSDRSSVRPYRVPGPDWFVFSLAIMSETMLLLTVIILCLQPGKDFVWTALPIIAGSVITVAAGEILIGNSLKKDKT